MHLKKVCLLYILLQLSLALTQDSLIKMSENSQCIKSVVDSFINNQACEKLQESQKSLLAIKMTNCLNIKLGKDLIEQCKDLKKCKIQGDDWNTFTAFYTHIDNLCHFYWDLVKHQRNTAMISGLSESAFLAQDVLKKNYQSTQEILSKHEKISHFMAETLASNELLADTLKTSEHKIQNITKQIESFLGQLNSNLIDQYRTIIQTIAVMNSEIDEMNSIQVIMASQIDSISGMVYFFVQLIIILVITSFGPLRKCRLISFTLFLLNILCQLLLPSILMFLLNIKFIRSIFVLVHFAAYIRILFKKEQNFDQMKSYCDGRFNTQKIKRIFKEIIDQQRLSVDDEDGNRIQAKLNDNCQ